MRKDYLRASKIMQERVMESENIEVLFETQTVGLFGENGVEGAHLVKYKGTDREEYVDIAIDGFFLAIGHTPNTKAFPAIATDEAGYIITNGRTTATNIPGVFAAGDVARPTLPPSYHSSSSRLPGSHRYGKIFVGKRFINYLSSIGKGQTYLLSVLLSF